LGCWSTSAKRANRGLIVAVTAVVALLALPMIIYLLVASEQL
jgi:hypothetical protein